MQAQYNRTQVGDERDAYGQAGYLWGSGMNQADLERTLFYQFRGRDGHYFLHDFMKYFGNRSYPGFTQDFEWREMGKTREGTTVTTVSATGSATITAKTGRTYVYHQPNEILNMTNGIQARVTAAVLDAGEEMLTLVKKDGTNWAAGQMVTGRVLGNSHNSWGEGTDQPLSRTWRPAPKANKYTIVKATSKFTGDALTTRMEFEAEGGTVWVYENQKNTVYEFFRDRENALMWSEESIAGAAVNETRGFVRDIEANASAVTTYTGAADEADIQAELLLFDVLADSDEHLLLAGRDLFFDAQRALKDYFLDGAVYYGEFNGRKNLAVGFGVKQYSFGNKILDLVQYRGFSDQDVTGAPPAGATATETNYRQFGLFLNLGRDGMASDMEGGGSVPFLSYKYKMEGGVDRSLVCGHLHGMTGMAHLYKAGGISSEADYAISQAMMMQNQVATPNDSEQFFMLSQIGARLVNVENAHGYMRAIG